MKILELENDPLAKLRKVAKELNVPNFNKLKRNRSSCKSVRRRRKRKASSYAAESLRS